MKILHLHVKKKYWPEVRSGKKKEEYREIKGYWRTRLKKNYTHIYYWLAYTSQKMVFKYNGFTTKRICHPEFKNQEIDVFAIDISKRIE